MLGLPKAIERRIWRRYAGVSCLLAVLSAVAPRAQAATLLPSSDITPAVLARIPLGNDPTAIAVDSQRSRVYVAEIGPPIGPPPHPGYLPPRGPGTVQIFDSATGRLLRTTPAGVYPVAIAVAEPAGRIFVAASRQLIMLDAATGRALRTIAFTNTLPRSLWAVYGALALAVDEHDNRLFLLTGEAVNTYNATTGVLLGTAPLGYLAAAMAFDPTSGHLLVAGQQLPPPAYDMGGECDPAQFCPDKISLLDGSSGRLLATTVLPGPPLGNPTPLGACGIGVDAALHRALIARTPEGRARSSAVIVDTRSGKVVATLDLYFGGCAVQVDEQHGRAFVLTVSNAYAPQTWDMLTIVDLHTGALADTVMPGGQFSTLALDERSQRLFLLGKSISNIATLSVLDLRTGALPRGIPLGTAPWHSSVGAPPAVLAVDERTAHLFAALPAGSVGASAVLLMLNAT